MTRIFEVDPVLIAARERAFWQSYDRLVGSFFPNDCPRHRLRLDELKRCSACEASQR